MPQDPTRALPLDSPKFRPVYIDRLKKDQARVERRIAIARALLPMVPEQYQDRIRLIMESGYRAAGSIIVNVRDRADAVAFLDAASNVRPVPLRYIRGTFTTIIPEESLTDRDWRGATHDINEVLPYVFKCSPFGDGVQAELEFWAPLDGFGLINWTLRMESDPLRYRADHERNSRGRIVRHRWRLDGCPNGEVIRYASGSPSVPGHRKWYFYREPGAGPTLADYLAGNMPA